jgi:NCS1 family nucleobase:cation symporter-1
VLPQGLEQQLSFEELAANEGFFDHESVSTITGVLEGEVAVVEHDVAMDKELKA